MEDVRTAERERGRDFYRQRAWSEAFHAFAAADQSAALDAEDLELFAMAACLIGRDEDYLSALDRAHHAHLQSGATLRGVRCVFWLALRLLFRGEAGRATGWFARAQRLIECESGECAERGYLLLPVAEQHLRAGDSQAGYADASRAAEIADHCGDADLLACARHLQGRALIHQGEMARGLAFLDETMVAVASGNLSPMVTGLMYCSVIDACQQIYAISRAHEWTTALAQWCDEQPEMVAFTGTCLVHRAEILQLHGAWDDAIVQARRACERGGTMASGGAIAAACYQLADVHRLRGEFAEAEEAYRKASEGGFDPQPGLALLRLAQGRKDAAASAIRRVAGVATGRRERTNILSAYVEIMLATGDIPAADEACRDLEQIAERLENEVVGAIAAHARGATDLVRGDAYAALGSLRRAWHVWQRIDAPYLAARARVLIGLACRALGDEDGTALELDAARATFEKLEAAPDLATVDSIRQAEPLTSSHGLTRRELQVLRLVATGKTNKNIASELVLSEKTIDRHVSNIFTKLSVPSRAAATAYAYRHQLM